jgi:uncharacterized coiled-coil DUF342 family protein
VNDDHKYLDELPQTLERVLGDTRAILAGQKELREKVDTLGERVGALSEHVRQVRVDLSHTMTKNDQHRDELHVHAQKIQTLQNRVAWVIAAVLFIAVVLGVVMWRVWGG